jgi:D-alanyl-D-alanine carboxypeptidase (penicillin-binding protein 5/6)
MRRFATLLLAFFFISAPTFAAEKKAPQRKPPHRRPNGTGITWVFRRPFTVPGANDANVFPFIEAQAAILCDASNGRVLYEKNADDERVASTQKLLTARSSPRKGDLDGKVDVEAVDGKCEPSKLGLKAGETYKRYDLLRILLVKSMNDVARCLARDNAGSITAFANKMNAKAREIGMRALEFREPERLDGARPA